MCFKYGIYTVFVGLARTIYIRCAYGIFGREITVYTVIYGAYIWFWPTVGIWYLYVMGGGVIGGLHSGMFIGGGVDVRTPRTYTHMYNHTCTQKHTLTCTLTLTRTNTHALTHTLTRTTHTHSHTYPHMYNHTSTHKHKHTHTNTHTYTHTHTRTHTHTLTCTITLARTNTNTHTYTHKHTHAHPLSSIPAEKPERRKGAFLTQSDLPPPPPGDERPSLLP